MNPEYTPRTTRLLLAGSLSLLAVVAGTAQVEQGANYRRDLAVSEALQPFLTQLEPGSDGFPLERQAKELEARLRELSDALRGGAQATGVANRLLDPDFRGARLLPIDSVEDGGAALEVKRAKDLPREATLDARGFGAELQRLIGEFRDVTVAEFLITSIESEGSADPPSSLRTTVRYDIVGGGTKTYRIEHVGEWDMRWRRGESGWQVVRWLPTSHLVSRARRPVFTEITEAALGRIDSFRRQLTIDLDSWMATFDSVLTRDSNGHHGVSVGDADGDGLDDLYIAQPAGLPNRLYRNRGDSTFEDITDDAGVAVLDDTAQSLFADVDNDGDQDLVVATSTGLLLFVNDGKGRFTFVADAFRLAQPFQGVPTSIAMADYDRDGFLDLYVCVYLYLFGAGEDKAGTPAPYHDARNGPPSVLFRNDGRGRFIDVTAEAGLDIGNDHYHFAAAWADYDGDGWPDLLRGERLRDQEPVPEPGTSQRHGDVRGRRCIRRAARSRRGDERHISRLRQRRFARHLHRQHVERARAAHHLGADVHGRCATRRARALSPARAGQFAVPKSREWTLRGQDARGARRHGALGVVVGRARLRQ